MYSQAMKRFERRTASEVISSSSRLRPAFLHGPVCFVHAPCMLLAFLKVESGCSCRPRPG